MPAELSSTIRFVLTTRRQSGAQRAPERGMGFCRGLENDFARRQLEVDLPSQLKISFVQHPTITSRAKTKNHICDVSVASNRDSTAKGMPPSKMHMDAACCSSANVGS